ncbi:MAG: HAD-IA family hydrolase [Propionibacteriaceae bacterium]|jgi:beta-phosphoglucomutase-like phosphatase (HAD superfamily)|nr:HAD-IA family hydrolase [Propionibacteriaceae bacterium]
MPALIFDCDGVLADTERDGHRVAFNRLFAEAGLPLRWDDAEYERLLRIGGGKERLTSVITPERAAAWRMDDIPATVARWHARKSALYLDLIATGAIPPRPGVGRLIGQALAAGWPVAVASTSLEASVRAVLELAVGPGLASQVAVYAGDIVARKKPAPDIYRHALADLGLTPAEAVVVEDSGIGCAAAVAAGLRTIVTVSAYTAADDFSGASLVLTDLGEPGRPAQALADPADLPFGGLVDLALLEAVLA